MQKFREHRSGVCLDQFINHVLITMVNADPEVDTVALAILGADPAATEQRIAEVLRDTIDQLLNGQHTGRYRWDQLHKTEKTHAGTLVEINLQRAFKFPDGDELDYRIAGIETDCKFSQRNYSWMLPPESIDHICIVAWASDELAKWSLGLVRITENRLSKGSNRDEKKTLNEEGRRAVHWLFDERPLPPNVFLQLREEQVKDIFAQRSGQKKVNRLFVHAQHRLVGRAAVATAAQQDDFMKRVRESGGAREKLRPLGFVILGHEHRELARELGLPIPSKGQFVSARLVPSATGTLIDGKHWRVARISDGESVTHEAPILPRAKGD